MTNYEETAPEITQLNSQILKVFDAYSAIKLTIAIGGFAIFLGLASGYTSGMHLSVWLQIPLQFSGPIGALIILVCYLAAVVVLIRHGGVVKKYRATLQRYSIQATPLFLRAQAGYKKARSKAIILGLSMLVPIAIFSAFIAMVQQKMNYHV